MSGLLSLKKYAAYDQIDKPTRSFMYKLCDHIEDAGLSAADKMRWRHPQAIAKHCPQKFLSGPGGETPSRARMSLAFISARPR